MHYQTISSRINMLFSSPVAVKEMRTRMRGWRTPVLLGAATGLPMLFFLVRLWMLLPGALPLAEYLQSMAHIGHQLFVEQMVVEALLCNLLVPVLVAGSFAGERETQMLEALFLSRLTVRELLWGKFWPMLLFVLMILGCALPVMAITFAFGSVSPNDIIGSLLLILSTVTFQGMLGLYISIRSSRTVMAVALGFLAYLGWLVLLVGLILTCFQMKLLILALFITLIPALLVSGFIEHYMRWPFIRIFWLSYTTLIIAFSIVATFLSSGGLFYSEYFLLSTPIIWILHISDFNEVIIFTPVTVFVIVHLIGTTIYFNKAVFWLIRLRMEGVYYFPTGEAIRRREQEIRAMSRRIRTARPGDS